MTPKLTVEIHERYFERSLAVLHFSSIPQRLSLAHKLADQDGYIVRNISDHVRVSQRLQGRLGRSSLFGPRLVCRQYGSLLQHHFWRSASTQYTPDCEIKSSPRRSAMAAEYAIRYASTEPVSLRSQEVHSTYLVLDLTVLQRIVLYPDPALPGPPDLSRPPCRLRR